MVTKQDVDNASAELDAAVHRWLKVKAAYSDDDDDPRVQADDPILLGWVVIASYTSLDLEQHQASATAYDCADGQIAPLSRGLSMAGVDQWAQG